MLKMIKSLICSCKKCFLKMIPVLLKLLQIFNIVQVIFYFINKINSVLAQGKDHRNCCERAGVGETIAGEKCLIFCDQRPGQINKLTWDYLACYDRFESIKRCFYDEIKDVAIKKFTPQLENPKYAEEIF